MTPFMKCMFLIWFQYIEDVFGVWHGDTYNVFVGFQRPGQYNKHPNITFTNHTNSISFLDIEISIIQDGQVCTEFMHQANPQWSSSTVTLQLRAHPKHVMMGVDIWQMKQEC